MHDEMDRYQFFSRTAKSSADCRPRERSRFRISGSLAALDDFRNWLIREAA
jgi:hypothetical protein